jgi:tRNA-splicing endonuclease subunit Sen54
MGKQTGKEGVLWLLPEEALYLVERGSLDLWWPWKEDEAQGDDEDGLPMSLQAVYAMLLGTDGEVGKVGLERYSVFAGLKRLGYVVIRAPEWDGVEAVDKPVKETEPKLSPHAPKSLLAWLFYLFEREQPEPPSAGPLVKPGLYRSYSKSQRCLYV